MFERTARSWALMRQSWRVLKLDRELLLFPILSTIACLLVMASFAAPVVLSQFVREELFAIRFDGQGEVRERPDQPVEVVAERQSVRINFQRAALAAVGFVFFVSTNFVIVYFNTALVSCAMIRFSGGNPTLGDGLRAATARLPQIIGWVLLTSTVGMVLRAIEERVPLVGKWVVGLIGMAWAIVTFMVVPILAAEKVGPLAAVKRSASLLRKTWGESIIGQVSLGGVQFLLLIPAFAGLIAVVVASIMLELIWPIAVAVGLAVCYLVLLSIVFSTLQQIFLAAVYRYAADGAVPAGFSADLIASAFKPKHSAQSA